MLEFFITLALCDPSGGLCDYDKAYQTKTISVYENALMLSQSACRSALEKTHPNARDHFERKHCEVALWSKTPHQHGAERIQIIDTGCGAKMRPTYFYFKSDFIFAQTSINISSFTFSTNSAFLSTHDIVFI
jgi:hypothetical protein